MAARVVCNIARGGRGGSETFEVDGYPKQINSEYSLRKLMAANTKSYKIRTLYFCQWMSSLFYFVTYDSGPYSNMNLKYIITVFCSMFTV